MCAVVEIHLAEKQARGKPGTSLATANQHAIGHACQRKLSHNQSPTPYVLPSPPPPALVSLLAACASPGDSYQEKFFMTPGDTGFQVYDTRYGRLGVAICWDQWFPEPARILALKGAEVGAGGGQGRGRRGGTGGCDKAGRKGAGGDREGERAGTWAGGGRRGRGQGRGQEGAGGGACPPIKTGAAAVVGCRTRA
jgi:hypothetical protein